MGNKQSIQKVNFEDIQNILSHKQSQSEKNIILINTLENTSDAQSCILPTTVPFSEEEKVINHFLNNAKDVAVVIYGRNSNDVTIYQKYQQLIQHSLTKEMRKMEKQLKRLTRS